METVSTHNLHVYIIIHFIMDACDDVIVINFFSLLAQTVDGGSITLMTDTKPSTVHVWHATTIQNKRSIYHNVTHFHCINFSKAGKLREYII